MTQQASSTTVLGCYGGLGDEQRSNAFDDMVRCREGKGVDVWSETAFGRIDRTSGSGRSNGTRSVDHGARLCGRSIDGGVAVGEQAESATTR